MIEPFRVQHRLAGDTLVIEAFGELDIATEPRVRAVVEERAQHHQGPVVIDLSGLEFMDSTGLRLLIQAQGSVADLALVHGPPQVRRLLDVSGVTERFRFVEAAPA